MLKASAVEGQPCASASKAIVCPSSPTPAPPHFFGTFSARKPSVAQPA